MDRFPHGKLIKLGMRKLRNPFKVIKQVRRYSPDAGLSDCELSSYHLMGWAGPSVFSSRSDFPSVPLAAPSYSPSPVILLSSSFHISRSTLFQSFTNFPPFESGCHLYMTFKCNPGKNWPGSVVCTILSSAMSERSGIMDQGSTLICAPVRIKKLYNQVEDPDLSWGRHLPCTTFVGDSQKKKACCG